MTQIDLVLPVYNGENYIEKSIRKLHDWIKQNPDHEYNIVIAINASTDNTLNIAKKLESELPNEIRVMNIPQKGRGVAIRTGWENSNAEICAYMDADLSADLKHITEIIEPIIKNEAQICCGSRKMQDSSVKTTLMRGVLSWLYNLTLRTTLGLKIADSQCGFKSIRTDAAKKIIPLVESNGWFFDSELLVIAQKNGFKIKAVPVKWIDDVQTTVIVPKIVTEFLKGIKRMRKNGIPEIPD